jgi:hypothetical protein
MSTAAPQPGNPPHTPATAPLPPRPTPPEQPRKREIVVISHCTLFYWWPVWAVGFLMGIISMVDGHRLAVVPVGTTAWKEKVVIPPTDDDKKTATHLKIQDNEPRDVLIYPLGAKIAPDPTDKNRPQNPYLHISANKNLGILFIVVLLLVIVITNIPLRGLWSVIVIVLIVSLAIIFALLEWWAIILEWLSLLDIRITAGGYFSVALVLFVLWLIVMLVFDQQIYMIFTPGQLRVRTEIGDAETAFDTSGMTVQKQRSDLFRHWVLGIGSGDLIVKTAGANSQEFHFPNVLFIGRKVKEIEDMMREKQVVTSAKP